jgi:hypothetical protein
MKKITFNASVPKYKDGNTILVGLSAFQSTCECGATTHVLEIGLGVVLLQFAMGHEH